ncbi:MAG: group III truncated hemoglobin [Rhodothermaceae bacterium]|nr:group III truncated hemoglobin [Rhodothermaceae bacterium]
MPKEIENEVDIKRLVDAFYSRVREDDLLRPVFEEVAGIDWESHLPRMYAFWETVLLNRAAYKGNPVLKHVNLARKTTLSETHFTQWLRLWNQTVDQLFQGPRAQVAKERASMMSTIMRFKCDQTNLQITAK